MKKAAADHGVVDTLSLQDLCRFCQADETWIIELVEYGVIEPQGTTTSKWHFAGINIVRAKKARRLNRDLGINTAGVAMVIDLLEEREEILRRLARHEPI